MTTGWISRVLITAALATVAVCGSYNLASANNYALVIGISQYSAPDINGLHYADSDAKTFYGLLRDSPAYTPDCIRLLANSDATRDAILDSLRQLDKDCGQKGASTNAVIFFAGHAVLASDTGRGELLKLPAQSKEFLVPADARWAEANTPLPGGGIENNTLITKQALAYQISRLHARNVALIVDACHSAMPDLPHLLQTYLNGPVSETAAAAPEVEGARGLGKIVEMPSVLADKNAAFLSASGSDEKAYEFDELGHGALSYAIIRSLEDEAANVPEGQTQLVTIGTLYADLDNAFQATRVEGGQPLSMFSQPQLYYYPDQTTVPIMVISGRKVTSTSIQTPAETTAPETTTPEIPAPETPKSAVLAFDGLPAGSYVQVNGQNETLDSSGRVSVPAGANNNVAFFIPQWSYSHVELADLLPGEEHTIPVVLTGALSVQSIDASNPSVTGPPLAISVDGQPLATSASFRTNSLRVGSHLMTVNIEGVTAQTDIEIRPDSPLTVQYLIRRVPAKTQKNDMPFF